MGMCAIPQDPPPRNTSKAKLTTFKLAPLPEKYRRGYELAVERLAGRKPFLGRLSQNHSQSSRRSSVQHLLCSQRAGIVLFTPDDL